MILAMDGSFPKANHAVNHASLCKQYTVQTRDQRQLDQRQLDQRYLDLRINYLSGVWGKNLPNIRTRTQWIPVNIEGRYSLEHVQVEGENIQSG